MPRYWAYNLAGQLQPLDGSTPIDPPEPPDPPGGKLWWPGISRSTAGLNASPSSKQTATLQRFDQMAAASGVPAATLRAHAFYHFYHSGTTAQWNVSTGAFSGVTPFAKNNGFLGVCVNMKVADTGGATGSLVGLQTWADGGFDANFRAYLASMQALAPLKFVVIIEHEPNNNTSWTAGDRANYRKGTARFMKIVYELNDPNIIFSLCFVPTTSVARSEYNPRPDLNTLCGSVAAAQLVMDATLCGLDPYPEVENDGVTLQTLEGRCRAALNDYKSWGFTRFSMPEVAFFNYKANESGPGPLDAQGQADRLHRELWTWAKANGFEHFNYFDVTSASNPRGDSRILDTTQEQAEYARIIMNNA